MNVNESNQVGKTTPTNPQENGAQKAEQKQAAPPSVWLHDNGDGYFQVTDLAGIVEENEINLGNGVKLPEKVDVKREFIREFGTKLKECLNKPLSEVQSKIQGYIDTFLEAREAEKARKRAEDQNRQDGDDLLAQLPPEETPEEPPRGGYRKPNPPKEQRLLPGIDIYYPDDSKAPSHDQILPYHPDDSKGGGPKIDILYHNDQIEGNIELE